MFFFPFYNLSAQVEQVQDKIIYLVSVLNISNFFVEKASRKFWMSFPTRGMKI